MNSHAITQHKLPANFAWATLDIKNSDDLNAIYELLSAHYVTDPDETFRFDYSKEFLLWALSPPGYIADCHIGVRGINGKLYGLITGIPIQLSANNKLQKAIEINFLCVHSTLRSKRMAPVLIAEITRRAQLNDISQAVYTTAVDLSATTKTNKHNSVTTVEYWHRALQPKKLIDIGFMQLGKMSFANMVKYYRLPAPEISTSKHEIRLMRQSDIQQVHSLLNSYLEKLKLYTVWDEKEIEHWLLPIPNVISTYVIENNGEIKGFFSYFHLNSTILKNKKYDKLYVAYSFYTVVSSDIKIEDLTIYALHCAYKDGCDVFNATTVMNNESFLKSKILKFGKGNGNLHYYLHDVTEQKNYKPNEIGVVML